jgi:hypothetical protein
MAIMIRASSLAAVALLGGRADAANPSLEQSKRQTDSEAFFSTTWPGFPGSVTENTDATLTYDGSTSQNGTSLFLLQTTALDDISTADQTWAVTQIPRKYTFF